MASLRAHRRILTPLLVLSLAALVYTTAGFRNTLIRDAGGYLYAGQQVLKGVPPYKSIFTHKGPIAPLVVAAGVALARPLGMPDVYSVRLLFCLIGCLSAAAVYLLVGHLLDSWRAGLLGALTFLGFYPFTFGATAGPEPKLPMVLFMTLSLYLTSRRRWLWAGVCGSLSALTWQPTIIFPAATLLLAALQPPAQRRRSVALTVAGGIVPLLAVLAYFAERKALPELLNNAVLFNLVQLDRGDASGMDRALWPVQVILTRYTAMLVPIVIGFVMLAVIYVWRIRRYRTVADAVQDPFAALLITLPLPIIWSVRDFQGPPDFFVFLPYVSLGFAFLLFSILRYVEKRSARPWVGHAILAGVCLVLLSTTVRANRERRDWGLEYQLQAAAEIEARFGKDLRVFARGIPQTLALLHKDSPTPYMNLAYVVDVQEALIPGGFQGWLKTVEEFDPHIVACERAEGRHGEEFMAWLQARYVVEKIGPWTIWVRKGLEKTP